MFVYICIIIVSVDVEEMNVDPEMLNGTYPCINGRCISLGVCACDHGWTGDNCTIGTIHLIICKDFISASYITDFNFVANCKDLWHKQNNTYYHC